ncbi:hypothetical protein PINS_up000266 [Pythium insidiosum]|nr:hypothetical protein PINS_up000266 [Pythium insidiosum]
MTLWFYDMSPTSATAGMTDEQRDRWRHERQRRQGDLLLLSLVLVFLIGSYIVCKHCRCRRHRRHLHAYPVHQHHIVRVGGYSYTQLNAPASGDSTLFKPMKREAAVLVSEMEEPFLGPPEYEQPSYLETAPPAYAHLPSAPPLSDTSEDSPRHF